MFQEEGENWGENSEKGSTTLPPNLTHYGGSMHTTRSRSSMSSQEYSERRRQIESRMARELKYAEEQAAFDEQERKLTIARKKADIMKTFQDEACSLDNDLALAEAREQVLGNSDYQSSVRGLPRESQGEQLQRYFDRMEPIQLPRQAPSQQVVNEQSSRCVPQQESQGMSPFFRNVNEQSSRCVPQQESQGVSPFFRNMIDHDNTNFLNSPGMPGQAIVQHLDRLQSRLELPATEIEGYHGDSLDYPRFIVAFEINVESKTRDEGELFQNMRKYCHGKAAQAIKKFDLEKDRIAAFRGAKAALRDNFGQPHMIVSAIEEKIDDFSQIGADNRQSLKNYADLLETALIALRSIGTPSAMDHKNYLVSVVSKLSFGDQKSWLKKASKIKQERDSIFFSDVVNFVQGLSRSLNDTEFSVLLDKKKSVSVKHRSANVMERCEDSANSSHAVPVHNQDETELHTPMGSVNSSPNRIECSNCPSSPSHKFWVCDSFTVKPYRVKLDIIQSKRLCFNCLNDNTLRPHPVRQCPLPKECKVTGCQSRRKHHTVLHRSDSENASPTCPSPGNQGGTTNQGSSSTPVVEDNACAASSNDPVFFLTVPVRVYSPVTGETRETYAVIDGCASTTLVTEDFLTNLGLPLDRAESCVLTLKTANGLGHQVSSRTTLHVSDLQGGNSLIVTTAQSWSELPISDARIPCESVWNSYDHLKNLPRNSLQRKKVEILIGGEVAKAHLQLEHRESSDSHGPVAVRNLWGWGLIGGISTVPVAECWYIECETHKRHEVDVDQTLELAELSIQLKTMAEFEYIGTVNQFNKPISVEDVKARKILEEGTYLCDRRYYVPVPKRPSMKTIPNNRSLALKFLLNLTKRILKDDNLLQQYCENFRTSEEAGYIRRVPLEELLSDATVYYLIFHHVTHPRKPGRFRTVWNAALKYLRQCFNDHVYTGEDRLNSLLGVLLRFRCGGEIGIQADIDAMFNRVCTVREDWDLARFLWYSDEVGGEIAEYQHTVTFFGGAHSPGNAAYALYRTSEDNKEDFEPDVCNAVMRNTYVDDFLKSCSPQDAVKVIPPLIELLERGGFRLAKFLTSDPELLNEVIPEDRRAESKTRDLSEDEMGHVLGIVWNATDDTFTYRIEVKERPFTRRGLTGHIHAPFDPEGGLAPVLLPAKILLHKLTRLGYHWDDPMPQEDEVWLREWLESLSKLIAVRRSRYYLPKGFGATTTIELHGMSDGSETGYGFVWYIRCTRSDGTVHVNFVFGKSLVAPKNIKTIYRMELQAAYLCLRSCMFVVQEAELEFDTVHLWIDSTAVIQTLRNEQRRFQVFVANRIQDMREIIQKLNVSVRYVSSENNVADDCSRGQTVDEFLKNERYYNGPAFLWNPCEEWPVGPPLAPLSSDFPEFRKKDSATCAATEVVVEPLMKLVKRHSTWTALQNSVTWLRRFCSWIMSKVRPQTVVKTGPLTLAELRAGSLDIIRYVQQVEFKDVLRRVKTLGPRATHKEVNCLRPFIDDTTGVLRVGGRIEKASLSYDRKHQIILPKNHHLAKLIARQCHRLNLHAPPNTLLCILRERYWPISGPTLCRKVTSNCLPCQVSVALPHGQLQGSLPESRVAEGSIWGVVGADVMGSVLVKVGRSNVKRYVIGFVSFSVKAVHFEVMESIDTEAFLNAFTRFICRRNRPEELVTDNGGNFDLGVRELNQLTRVWNDDQVQDYMMQREIVWKPNVPKGSSRNGLFERPFRELRRAFLAVLKGQTTTNDQLATITIECERLYNSRPLFALSQDADDLAPLRPTDIINPEPSQALPPGLFDKADSLCRNRFRQAQFIVCEFWRRYMKEYIPSLQRRSKQLCKSRNFEIGDVCLLVNEVKLGHRGYWPMCRIIDVYDGHDDRVRVVRIKTATGEYDRPVDKLCLLEGIVDEY